MRHHFSREKKKAMERELKQSKKIIEDQRKKIGEYQKMLQSVVAKKEVEVDELK